MILDLTPNEATVLRYLLKIIDDDIFTENVERDIGIDPYIAEIAVNSIQNKLKVKNT